MPINPANSREFHRRLYGQILETLQCLKRSDDQKMGTVRTVTLFDVRRHAQVRKTGEPLQHDMSSDNQVTWVIPRTQMDLNGIAYFSAADRFVDKNGFFWQPEADTTIEDHLFSNFENIACKKVDPPAADQN